MELDDDRISCDSCKNFLVKTVRDSMPDHVMEKFIFMNHAGNRWMFPIVKISNKVATVVYKRRTCKVGPAVGPLAADIKHRCDSFCKIDDKGNDDNVKADTWWD